MVTPEELRERAEKESKKTQKEYMRDRRIQSLESSINSLCESVASLILKVSNEHKTSSGALPLMHSDTNTTQTHTTQTSEGGPADTTMRLNTGKQEVGIGGSRGPSTYSFPGPFIPPTGLTTAASIGANKYPTDTVITPVQGHKPLMSQDTPKQGKDTKTKGEEDVVMGEESTTPPTPPAKEEQERKEAQEARRKDAQDAVRKAGEVVRRDEVMCEAQVAQEATRKAEEDKITQEKKKAAEELELRTKIMEEETRQRREWMEKLQKLDEAKKRSTPTTIVTTSSTHTPTPTQQYSDYTEDESGTIVYAKGKGDKRWHQIGFCVRCKREVRSGEVRFFNKHQQIHTRCGTCPTCKESLAEADVEMGALRVWCGCGRAVEFFHQC